MAVSASTMDHLAANSAACNFISALAACAAPTRALRRALQQQANGEALLTNADKAELEQLHTKAALVARALTDEAAAAATVDAFGASAELAELGAATAAACGETAAQGVGREKSTGGIFHSLGARLVFALLWGCCGGLAKGRIEGDDDDGNGTPGRLVKSDSSPRRGAGRRMKFKNPRSRKRN